MHWQSDISKHVLNVQVHVGNWICVKYSCVFGFSIADALEKLDEPVLWGPYPSVALEGSVVDFYCEIRGKPATLSVQYELYVETNLSKLIGEYSSLSGEFATFSLFTTERHDGRLICKASGHNDTDIESSFSNTLDFRVIGEWRDMSVIL